MYKERHKSLMRLDRKRLGEEVCKVVFALPPDDVEVALAHAVADPMEPHVDALCPFELVLNCNNLSNI